MNGHAAKDEVPRYPGARCREWIAGLLQRCGMPPEDAALAARRLVRASLRGIDTHGVARLPAYVDRLLAGKLRASGRLRITDRRGFLVCDGDGILGQVAAHRAMDAVIAHARGAAPAACSVHNAGHMGALGCMRCRRPSRACSPSASTSRRSWHCRATARAIGNNPLAFALPVKRRPPPVFDMAASAVARGKVLAALREGHTVAGCRRRAVRAQRGALGRPIPGGRGRRRALSGAAPGALRDRAQRERHTVRQRPGGPAGRGGRARRHALRRTAHSMNVERVQTFRTGMHALPKCRFTVKA